MQSVCQRAGDEFDGMQFEIKGEPADCDEFYLTPSENESVFKTLSDLINGLKSESPAGGDAARAQYTNSVNRALNNIDRGLENISTIRTSLGSRLREIDALQVTGEDLGLQYKGKLSELQDVDFNKAVSDLNQQQTSLTAAQKSFKQVSDLSLLTIFSKLSRRATDASREKPFFTCFCLIPIMQMRLHPSIFVLTNWLR